MPSFRITSQWVFYLLLAGLFVTVAAQILNGRINTRHLFSGKQKGGGHYTSPERIQLFAFTLWTALNYLISVIDNPTSGKLPDVPEQTLYLLGGSHFVYLGGKAYAMLFTKGKETA